MSSSGSKPVRSSSARGQSIENLVVPYLSSLLNQSVRRYFRRTSRTDNPQSSYDADVDKAEFVSWEEMSTVELSNISFALLHANS